jgi:hypothetical protein
MLAAQQWNYTGGTNKAVLGLGGSHSNMLCSMVVPPVGCPVRLIS